MTAPQNLRCSGESMTSAVTVISVVFAKQFKPLAQARRNFGLDDVEKLAKLLKAMAPLGLADHLA